MLFDPLGSDQFLRRTRDDEAVDGRGNKFYLERKTQVEFPPFGALLAALLGICVALVLAGCGGAPSPQPALQPSQPIQAVNR